MYTISSCRYLREVMSSGDAFFPPSSEEPWGPASHSVGSSDRYGFWAESDDPELVLQVVLADYAPAVARQAARDRIMNGDITPGPGCESWPYNGITFELDLASNPGSFAEATRSDVDGDEDDEFGLEHDHPYVFRLFSSGVRRWLLHGKPHRTDGPAVVKADESEEWHQNGQLHRDNGPAVTYADGSQEWYQNGQLHRVDGPAVIYPADDPESDDPSDVEPRRPDEGEWWQRGELHRDGGPAVLTSDGDESWYQHGVLHREGGPAIIRWNGDTEWWRHGQRIYGNDSATTSTESGASTLATFDEF